MNASPYLLKTKVSENVAKLIYKAYTKNSSNLAVVRFEKGEYNEG